MDKKFTGDPMKQQHIGNTEDQFRRGLFRSLVEGLSLLGSRCRLSDALSAGVVQHFDGIAVEDKTVTVAGVSGSGGGPAVQVGSECAQALSSVLSAGFRLRDVEVLTVGGVQYTLIDR